MNDGSYNDSYKVGAAPSGVAPPDLPPAPEFDRRVSFHRMHFISVAVVVILPLLAVVGLFGLRSGVVEASDGAVELRVQYPMIERFKIRRPLRIELTNTGARPLESVEIELSARYISAFSDVAMTPSPDRIENGGYVFELRDVAAGETRTIAAEMQAQRYWRHQGTVSWRVLDAGGATSGGASVEFATLVWP